MPTVLSLEDVSLGEVSSSGVEATHRSSSVRLLPSEEDAVSQSPGRRGQATGYQGEESPRMEQITGRGRQFHFVPATTRMGEYEPPPPAYQEFDPKKQPQYPPKYPINNTVVNTIQLEIEQRLLQSRPGSPMLLYNGGRQTVLGVPVLTVEIDTEFYISVAYTKLKIKFFNNSGGRVDGIFILPTEGTVTSVSAQIGRSRFIETSYITEEEATAEGFQQPDVNRDDPTQQYIPGCFRLKLPQIPNSTAISITVEILDDLDFKNGRFIYKFPLNFLKGIEPPNIPPDQWLRITSKINCLLPNIRYGSETYHLTLLSHEGNQTVLSALPQSNKVTDFHLSYTTPTSEISAATLYSPPKRNDYDPRGCFVTIINPPSTSVDLTPRDIIFLFDRSGSMTGDPWQKGVQAISAALDRMREQDRFGIVCFDDLQEYFGTNENIGGGLVGGLFPANSVNKSNAKSWTSRQNARGLTDIKTPLEWAIQVLNRNKQKNRMQFVVLITDGAVDNEREIVRCTERLTQDIRVLTFGIGRYCNWYFLKMLSLRTRGWNSGAVMAEDIDPRMDRMMNRANVPILRDVELDISGISEAELYPPRIPDLFAGKPIVIAGRVGGWSFPDAIKIKGIRNGFPFWMTIRTQSPDISKGVPVKRIFIKQQIDQLVSEQWLLEDDKLKKRLQEISVHEKMPTPFSHMVAFEVPANRKNDFEQTNTKGGRGLSGKQIAAMAGGAVVVGTGVFLLGNLGASLNGAPSMLDGFGSSLGGGGSGDCNACGDCGGDCECCDFAEGLGDCCTDLGEGIGECCGQLGEALGDCVAELAEGVGECFSGCVECCSGMGECVGECCSGCVDCLGEMGECVCECGDGCCDCAGECCDALGGMDC